MISPRQEPQNEQEREGLTMMREVFANGFSAHPRAVSITTSCSWCHQGNPLSRRYCKRCKHEAHLPRALCRCVKCAPSVGR